MRGLPEFAVKKDSPALAKMLLDHRIPVQEGRRFYQNLLVGAGLVSIAELQQKEGLDS